MELIAAFTIASRSDESGPSPATRRGVLVGRRSHTPLVGHVERTEEQGSWLGMATQARQQNVSTAELVDVLAGSALAGGAAMLREAGMYPSPSVHLIDEQAGTPYLGYVACRPFHRGGDATRAVAALGVLAGVVGATRLVVAWENDDMCTALELPEPDGGFATGFVVVDASRGGHVVRWHPFTAVVGPPTSFAPDLVSVIPEWGRETRRPNGRLLVPVAELLATWRAQPAAPAEVVACAEAMELAGYRLRWTVRE